MKTNFEKLPYVDFFGFTNNPFPIAPDAENFYISKHIEQILAEIIHGIESRKGFITLTGDVGLGKTTISRKILIILEEKKIETSLVFHTSFQDVELLREINRDFGLISKKNSFGDQMKLLYNFLLKKNQEQINCAIIVDDAQNLNNKSLELIRMISNLEANQQKLVQILLIGQSELMEKLNTPKLRQVKSRIIIKKEVKPLSHKDLENYLYFKLNQAGNHGQVTITKGTINKICKYTKGNFRRVNILMDRCFYTAFISNSTEIDKKIIKQAQKDINEPVITKRKLLLYFTSFLSLSATITIFLLFFLSYNQNTISSNTNTDSTSLLIKESKKIKQKIKSPEEDSYIDQKDNNNTNNNNNINQTDPIEHFLNYYGLIEYANQIEKALKNNNFNLLNKKIYNKTGNVLIQLNKLPEKINDYYGILSYPTGNNKKNSFFLFAKPALKIDNFNYYYQGNEIIELQKMLKKLNYYKYNIDGIVGKKLFEAVYEFQKSHEIKISGYPDNNTLFLLSYLSKM